MMPESMPASIAGAVDLSALAARHDQAAAPHQAATADGASGVIITITDADLPTLVELSNRVPVIVAIVADWSEPSQQLLQVLERLVVAQRGKLVLAKVEGERNAQITQAFQAQSVPTVAAVIGGRPAPLFTGALPEDQLQDVLAQVLEFAAQQGVTGAVPTGDGTEADGEEGEAAEPVAPPVPPLTGASRNFTPSAASCSRWRRAASGCPLVQSTHTVPGRRYGLSAAMISSTSALVGRQVNSTSACAVSASETASLPERAAWSCALASVRFQTRARPPLLAACVAR